MDKFFTTIFNTLLGYCLVILLIAGIAMWLWNAIIPVVFMGPTLTFWQMFQLMVLIRLIVPVNTTAVETKCKCELKDKYSDE